MLGYKIEKGHAVMLKKEQLSEFTRCIISMSAEKQINQTYLDTSISSPT